MCGKHNFFPCETILHQTGTLLSVGITACDNPVSSKLWEAGVVEGCDVGGKLTNVDTEVGHVGGELVTDNSSFNPQGPTCCSPRRPCSRWPVIAFTQATESITNRPRLNSQWVFVWCWWCGMCVYSILYVWAHENVFANTQHSVIKLKFSVALNRF